MSERDLFDLLLVAWFVLAALVFGLLFFVTAPYGRQTRAGWGPQIPSRLGWLVMELPPVLVPLVCLALASHDGWLPRIFCGLWLLHYLHRAFIYPLRMRMDGKRMPLVVALMGFGTNIGIDYLNFRWLFTLGPAYELTWLADPRFVLGVLLFLLGFGINLHSDHILRTLREPGETGYKIPRGGLFRWVSCPNYAGELLEWSGWALATWSLPGLAFAVWSAANLVPRAVAHHRWYQRTFEAYPAVRRALVPGLL